MRYGNKIKPTKATVAQRTEEILRIRLDGAEFWDCQEYIREKEKEAGSAWELRPQEKPMSVASIWRYISYTDKAIAESCRISRKRLLRNHLAKRRNLYAKAVSQGDTRAALAVLADEAKLIGLYAPTKTALTSPDGKTAYVPLTDAERTAALAAINATANTNTGEDPTMGNGSEGSDLEESPPSTR